MFVSAFARRSGRILSQVRLIRSHPVAVTNIQSRREPRKKAPLEYETITVGELVDEKFENFRVPKKRNPLEDPKVVTLTYAGGDEVDKDTEPKEGYTDAELAIFDRIEEIKIDDALEDFKKSKFDADFLDSLGPGLTPTFNVAAIADKHEVVKKLVELNVSMFKWDKKPEIFSKMVKLQWKQDCEPKVKFLVGTCGLDATALSKVLSRNPLLLTEELQHLEARLEFLQDKSEGLGFKKKEINRILSKEALWLSTPIESIQNRIQFFRSQFALSKHDFKQVIVSRPQIIMRKLRNLALQKFSMIEELGFTQAEIRKAIMSAPKILTLSRSALVERFEVWHLDIGLSQEFIASNARALYARTSRIKERDAFLKHLKRNQYDPSKPGYISPMKLVSGTDEIFVETVAKSTKEEFEKFIKTL